MEEIPADIQQALKNMNWEERLERARAQREAVLQRKSSSDTGPTCDGAAPPATVPATVLAPVERRDDAAHRARAAFRHKAARPAGRRIAPIGLGFCAGLAVAAGLFAAQHQFQTATAIVAERAPAATAAAPSADAPDETPTQWMNVAAVIGTASASPTPGTARTASAVWDPRAIVRGQPDLSPAQAGPADDVAGVHGPRGPRSDRAIRARGAPSLPILASVPRGPGVETRAPERPRPFLVAGPARPPSVPGAGARVIGASAPFEAPSISAPQTPARAPAPGAAPTLDRKPPRAMFAGAEALSVLIFASAHADPDFVASVHGAVEDLGLWVGPVRWVTYPISKNRLRFYDAASAGTARALADRISALPQDFSASGDALRRGTWEIHLSDGAASLRPGLPIARADPQGAGPAPLLDFAHR